MAATEPQSVSQLIFCEVYRQILVKPFVVIPTFDF